MLWRRVRSGRFASQRCSNRSASAQSMRTATPMPFPVASASVSASPARLRPSRNCWLRMSLSRRWTSPFRHRFWNFWPGFARASGCRYCLSATISRLCATCATGSSCFTSDGSWSKGPQLKSSSGPGTPIRAPCCRLAIAKRSGPAWPGTLTGDPPRPANPPSGGVFGTRCSLVQSSCATGVPKMVQASSGHSAACILTM